MTLSRRRFLSVSGALALAPSLAQGAGYTRWEGKALGAMCEITLRAPPAKAQPALEAALATLREVEAQFNLYDPGSRLSHLNKTGQLLHPSAIFAGLMDIADRMHRVMQGRFDPSIQPLWQALAHGTDVAAARAHVGWDRVRWSRDEIRLDAGQALSFNGIGQGYATDLVSQTLASHGFGDLLVNIGEFRAMGGPWRVGLSDPDHGLLGTRQLTSGAIATSSPRAMLLAAEQTHILDPMGINLPRWSTVSVEAHDAAVADALSTGLCLLDRDAAAKVKARLPEVHRITLVDQHGDLITL